MDSNLIEFAQQQIKGGWAWHTRLDDDIFNQVWDALNAETGIGEITVMNWLKSIGITDVTKGKIKGMRHSERR